MSFIFIFISYTLKTRKKKRRKFEKREEYRGVEKKAKVKADINNYCWSLVDFIGETNTFSFLQEQYHYLSRYVPFFFFLALKLAPMNLFQVWVFLFV